MKIAVLAHVRQPVAEPFMGGMEAHSWHLAAGLGARGHEVTLFASGDSDARFDISAILATHYEQTFPWLEHRGSAALNAHVDRGFEAACDRIAKGGFDVVHNNSLHRFPLLRARDEGMPTVTSLHVPPFEGLDWFVRTTAMPWHWITVTSRRQLDVWWQGAPPRQAAIVHNGIDLEQWPFSARGSVGGAVWSGRMTANKGPHLAIQAARQAGIPLTLFGVVEDPDYFAAMVAPLLGGEIRYGGHVDARHLARAFGAAAVLLFTPCWDEPFGLVAIEAMACGLPVAAFDRGASREVIGDEIGRFAAPDDVGGLADALRAASGLSRHAARERAERLFTSGRMLDAYEALYDNAIAGARTHPSRRSSPSPPNRLDQSAVPVAGIEPATY